MKHLLTISSAVALLMTANADASDIIDAYTEANVVTTTTTQEVAAAAAVDTVVDDGEAPYTHRGNRYGVETMTFWQEFPKGREKREVCIEEVYNGTDCYIFHSTVTIADELDCENIRCLEKIVEGPQIKVYLRVLDEDSIEYQSGKIAMGGKSYTIRQSELDHLQGLFGDRLQVIEEIEVIEE